MPITKATASSIAPAAKGDLVVGSATNDASVLAVGSANQVLTVDSSTTTGLKWAAAAAPSYSWAAYTPSFTDLTVGNGTVTARYAQVDKIVFFSIKLVFGSTTAVSGAFTVTLPVTAATQIAAQSGIYSVQAEESGVGPWFITPFVQANSTTAIKCIAWSASGTYVSGVNISATVPFTWGTNDQLYISGSYEAA